MKSQAEVIGDLLRGDYQSVFDHFMVRYALTGSYDLSTKFMMELRRIDEDLSFRNKDEEALYKLKLAVNFFFTESHTPMLSSSELEAGKVNAEVEQLMQSMAKEEEEEEEEEE